MRRSTASICKTVGRQRKSMVVSTFTDIERAFDDCCTAQSDATALWHLETPELPTIDEKPSYANLKALVLSQHSMNFSLWHVEDVARRRDVSSDVIADCKRAIDGYNQRRNDFMEKIDACFIALLSPLLPADAAASYNTESLGMAVDRLSILSLKIFHMEEQTQRTDVDVEHIANCRAKLAVLCEQREDLARSVRELMQDYVAGRKRPKVYFQCKMYNDPALNPELYGAAADNAGGGE